MSTTINRAQIFRRAHEVARWRILSVGKGVKPYRVWFAEALRADESLWMVLASMRSLFLDARGGEKDRDGMACLIASIKAMVPRRSQFAQSARIIFAAGADSWHACDACGFYLEGKSSVLTELSRALPPATLVGSHCRNWSTPIEMVVHSGADDDAIVLDARHRRVSN